MDKILEIENLSKQFTSVKALDNVSFGVERGTICGLLGPNGAGKTTLLRIINNILIADQGEVKVNGEPVSYGTSRYFGYMPEERGLYDKMRVEDQIIYFGMLKGGKEARLREVMKDYLQLFNLYDDRKRKIKELSKGNQQKVQIIATLVHEPEMVILDEPFSGFDPINGALLQELIAKLQNNGTTIMLSSHNMPAIEEMCRDIVLINHGHLLLQGDIEDIKDANKDGSLILTTSTPLNTSMLEGVTESIEETTPPQHRRGNAYRIMKKEGISNAQVLDAASYQSEITHFEEALPSLNDIFLKYTDNRHE